MKKLNLKKLIPDVKKRLTEMGDKAPFGDKFILDEPVYHMIGWPNKSSGIYGILSQYGVTSDEEKIFHLENMTKQFRAEIEVIRGILNEKLGPIDGWSFQDDRPFLAWRCIALPIREVGHNIIRIFPSDDYYGSPMYNVTSCDDFIKFSIQRVAKLASENKKLERFNIGLLILAITLSIWVWVV